MLKTLYKEYFDSIAAFWKQIEAVTIPWKLLAIIGIIVATLLVFAGALGLVLGVYWVFWNIFCYSATVWFPNLVLPNYWQFAGTTLFLVWARNLFFRKNVNATKD